MIEETGTAAALCIIGAVLATLLKQYCREHALFCSIGICTMIVLSLLSYFTPIADTINILFTYTTLDYKYLETLWKAIGICYIVGIASDLCKDSGEATLASIITLWGRITLLFLTLPMLEALLKVIIGVLN